jgi:hypothetical protein
MAKSQYFQTNPSTNSERRLIESLSQELTQLYGVEIYVIPNEFNNVDTFFREDRMPVLSKAFKVPVIFEDAKNGVSGDALFTKFGFTNNEEFSFHISAKEWREIAAANGVTGPGALRPMEGYIVFIPMQDEFPMFGSTDFFKISFIDKFESIGWFPLGIHHTLSVTCEKWSYSSESLQTGVPAVDSQEADFSNDITVNPNVNTDPWASNQTVQDMSNQFLTFDENSPFGTP